MAITGTGTQADPFKPTTWEEFLSCTTTDSVYTELPEGGGTFDMNDYYPEGITSTIPLRGFINGNGWTIKNAVYSGRYGAFLVSSSNSYGKVVGLNFFNFRFTTNITGAVFIEGGNSGTMFRLCQFSGLVDNTGAQYCAITRGNEAMALERCSYNIQIDCHAKSARTVSLDTGNWSASAHYCNVRVTGMSDYDTLNITPNSTYISGSIKSIRIEDRGLGAKESVIDTECDVISYAIGSATMTLVNTDKYSGSLPNGCIGVTTEQLKDAEYLSSLGFPIQT